LLKKLHGKHLVHLLHVLYSVNGVLAKSDKHIAKVAVKAVMRKAETKSFISANQSRSMTDDFFYYQNIFAPIASGSGSENREGEKIAVKNVKINCGDFI